jgi:hypothetical protein
MAPEQKAIVQASQREIRVDCRLKRGSPPIRTIKIGLPPGLGKMSKLVSVHAGAWGYDGTGAADTRAVIALEMGEGNKKPLQEQRFTAQYLSAEGNNSAECCNSYRNSIRPSNPQYIDEAEWGGASGHDYLCTYRTKGKGQ